MGTEPEPGLRSEIGGPLKVVARVGVALGLLVLLMVGLFGVWFLASSLTSTLLRLVVGMALAVVVALGGIGYFRQLSHPPPPDPEPQAVHPGLRLAYLCEMCGLEVAVLKIAKEKAPKHCGEAMVLIQREPD